MAEKCERNCEPLISGYLDGVLDLNERRWVEQHLQQCVGCRGLLEDLQEIRSVMMTTRWYEVSVDPVARPF